MNDFVNRHTSTAALRAVRSIAARLALASLLLAAACGTGSGTVDAPALAENASGAPGKEHAPIAQDDWCAAQRVLQAKCQRCHAAPPVHGAPFALVSHDDTQVVSARGTTRFAAIAKAVAEDFMPPSFIELEPPVVLLTDAEKQTLLDWCAAGAPPEPEQGCEAAD